MPSGKVQHAPKENLSAETRGIYLSTTALGELRTRLTRTRWTPMLRGARIRVPDGSRASFCSSGGARGFKFTAAGFLLLALLMSF